MAEARTRSWFESVPKVELHVHLEGAIPLGALFELVKKYGGDPQTPNMQALVGRFRYRDFATFIDTWAWKNQFLREYDDFTHIAEAFARGLARQNIRYAEASFSPADFARFKLEPARLAEAIRAGLKRVSGVDVRLIVDLVRDSTPDDAMATLQQAYDARELDIVGVGLGGSEQSCPAAPFAPVFTEARRMGFHTTAHAGEAAGADSIWSALNDLKVERIGHGTRAIDDEALLRTLEERKIPLEVCPTSNLRTALVPSIEEHPLRQFIARGLTVTINTDDPSMFGCTLAGELAMLETRLGLSRQQTRALILSGIAASFMTDKEKHHRVLEFTTDPAWTANL
ncbi:MAG: adenosine deaminase [Deltaproteobacteria bacterium]|nr:adenosine deaminase [Deltaproteobacteria bacterium]